MLKTPSGSPDSINSSPSRTAESGTFSEGLSTNVLPQVIATGNIQSGTIAGKLNGVIPAQTPTGWRIVSQSTCRAILASDWPMSRLGTPHANSTTSMPRWTDARASARVLPCSRVTRLASSSACAQPLAEPEHHARPLDHRSLGPGRQRRCGRLHGPIDLAGRAEGNLGDGATVRRVEYRTGTIRSARLPAASDQHLHGWRVRRVRPGWWPSALLQGRGLRGILLSAT